MTDKAASVLARLKNRAKQSGKPLQVHLRLFCQEEFLRRLSLSRYADNLILKGGKPQKIAQLLNVLEEGDDLKMVFIPGERTGIGEYVDCLYQKTRNSHISTT